METEKAVLLATDRPPASRARLARRAALGHRIRGNGASAPLLRPTGALVWLTLVPGGSWCLNSLLDRLDLVHD